jgi:hypothetical protein
MTGLSYLETSQQGYAFGRKRLAQGISPATAYLAFGLCRYRIITEKPTMTEADLLSQLVPVGDLLWSLMQYWTSLSIGILIGSYFVAKRLSIVSLTLILISYILFSFTVGELLRLQVLEIKGIAKDPNNLAENGVVLSNTTRTFLEHGPAVTENITGPIIRGLMFGIMFLVTLFYPIYCKRILQSDQSRGSLVTGPKRLNPVLGSASLPIHFRSILV